MYLFTTYVIATLLSCVLLKSNSYAGQESKIHSLNLFTFWEEPKMGFHKLFGSPNNLLLKRSSKNILIM